MAESSINSTAITVENVAEVIGVIVCQILLMAIFIMQLDKREVLKIGSYRSMIMLLEYAKQDINWWIADGKDSGHSVKPLHYDVEMLTDARQHGYGAVLNGILINGKWKSLELTKFGDTINCLEPPCRCAIRIDDLI